MPSLIRMMLTDSQGGNIAWALVYQISLDDRGRILISRSECFSFVLEYLLRCKEIPLPSIPLALAVNLAHVPKLATELSQVNSFFFLLLFLHKSLSLKYRFHFFKFSEQILCPVLGFGDRKSRCSTIKVTTQCCWSRYVISVKQSCRYGEVSRCHFKEFWRLFQREKKRPTS